MTPPYVTYLCYYFPASIPPPWTPATFPPHAAIITMVHLDGTVNCAFFGSGGLPYNATGVVFVAAGGTPPAGKAYCIAPS
jgi:hypothetical protein